MKRRIIIQLIKIRFQSNEDVFIIFYYIHSCLLLYRGKKYKKNCRKFISKKKHLIFDQYIGFLLNFSSALVHCEKYTSVVFGSVLYILQIYDGINFYIYRFFFKYMLNELEAI